MSQPHLILGNAVYSSWSLRAYIVMRRSGVAFTHEFVPVLAAETSAKMKALTEAGLVPALQIGDTTFGDSIAIAEWAAEQNPDLWPSDATERGFARFLAGQMHGGYMNLRRDLSMNLRRSKALPVTPDATRQEIAALLRLWSRALDRSGGPFLMGEQFTIADAFYTPVASRFRSYLVELDDRSGDYADLLLSQPEYQEWKDFADDETWHLPEFDLDQPQPLGQLK